MPPTPPPAASPDAALERLRALADAVPDRDFGGRLRRVFEEGARAIAGLGGLTLDRYDDLAETGAPDLSMWEELAPVIRDTLLDVNRLLSTIRELFPSGGGAIGELIGEALEEASAGDPGSVLLKLHEEEATEQIQALGNALAAEVSNLGERMRSPQVVSDRWNLLGDLQEFRGKFRGLVGELLFNAASPFEPVARAEVVPAWAEEVRDAVAARRAVTDLARVMSVHSSRIQAAGPACAERVAALVRDLDAFGRSRSYAVLRTQDKRHFVEYRALLSRAEPGSLDAATLAAIAEFAEFAQGLSKVNRRALLVEHDREVLAACAVKLEQADGIRASSPAQAGALLAEAAAVAQDLYGRMPSLDAWLRKARKRELAALPEAELEFEIELLRNLLASAAAL